MSKKPNRINDKALLKAFKSDMTSAEPFKNDWDAKIQVWKDEADGKPYGNEEAGKSKLVSRDIKKQQERQHASTIDPFVSGTDIVSCTPITWEDKASARQNQILLNAQFCRQFNRFNFMTKAMKVLEREGTVIIQTGWDSQEEDREIEIPLIEEDELGREFINGMTTMTETVVTRNQPTAKVCRNEDIYLDPTCQDDIDNCQFIIYRYETDLSTLKQDGKYSNLDKIKKEGDNRDVDYVEEDETNFRFEDDPRKKLVVYEYWGNYDLDGDGIVEPMVCAWVNDTIIRLGDNPYPDKKPPFIVTPLNSVPFQLHGESNAELISDNQKIKTAVARGLVNHLASATSGQIGMKTGSLNPINRKKMLAGQNYEYNGSPNDIVRTTVNSFGSAPLDMLALQDKEIATITGDVNRDAMAGSAKAAGGTLDASSTRKLNIVRNVSENLVKPLMRKWMAYNAEFLEESQVVRYTNEEFVEIKRDDLMGEIDIEITVSTAEDNAIKAQQLAFMQQTMGPNEDPAISREIKAMIMDLNKMPAEAKKIREFKPEPDPRAIAIQELEIQMLQAKLKNELAKGKENEVDAILKMAKAKELYAKSALTMSKKDREDLDFLLRDEGIDDMAQEKKENSRHRNMMEMKEHDRDTQIGMSQMNNNQRNS